VFTSSEDLGLSDYAKSAAEQLKRDFPTVVFTSGRRTVDEQASAMAGNIVKNRQWIAQTYAASAERDALQAWVDENQHANTAAAVARGLSGIMNSWADSQRVKLSRHFAGLAFDVRPTSDAKLKAAIRGLPHLVKFLENEGGLTIWHAEFSAKQNI
jgi:gamma-glutamyl:cysteine ligase YbdK (ATP-grasp superfamily)